MKRRTLMKRFITIRSLMLTLILLLGAIPVAAVERPFALNGTGVATFITNEAGLPISANTTASGTATHLGLRTAIGNVRFNPPDANGVIRSSGEATIIAANGDKLEVVVAGE